MAGFRTNQSLAATAAKPRPVSIRASLARVESTGTRVRVQYVVKVVHVSMKIDT